jgi:hypothetical protein
VFELRAESAVSKRRFDENAVLRQRGGSWFGFYLDEGALALANDGARFNSFGAVLAWAGEHDFEFVAKCEPEGSARVATEIRRNGGRT